MKTLILGGVRSGKSRLAESLAKQSDLPVCYIATATAGDDEMRQRIEDHRTRRPVEWTVVEDASRISPACTQRVDKLFVRVIRHSIVVVSSVV